MHQKTAFAKFSRRPQQILDHTSRSQDSYFESKNSVVNKIVLGGQLLIQRVIGVGK
jgi:hypothetical protein